VRDIVDVRRALDSSVDVVVVFSHLPAGIWLLVIAVDTFLNRKAAAVCPPNLMHCLPKNAEQARFVFRQQYTVAELCQVSSCRLLV
jgi:hypothetical protein